MLVMERRLGIRRRENLQAVKQKAYHWSALAQHATLDCDQGIIWKYARKKYLYEAVKICKELWNLAINRKDDTQKLHRTWKNILKFKKDELREETATITEGITDFLGMDVDDCNNFTSL